MHLRFVRLRIKEERAWDARKIYEDFVIPQLEQTDGCLFAGLLQGTIHGDESISMTVWTGAEAAESYEKSGLFDRILDETDEALQQAEGALPEQHTGGEGVIFSAIEPDVESWNVASAPKEDILDQAIRDRVFVRFVTIRLRRGAFAEFQRRFDDEVRPALAQTPGCLGCFLVAGTSDDSRVISVTVWEREEDAVRYGLSGEFERLTIRLRDTFSDLYQWSVAWSGDSAPSSLGRGREPEIEGYHLVVGKRFE
jgi:heme-degrading monooxygenase HmoA